MNRSIDRSELLNRKISSIGDAKKWIVDLFDADLMFHFEDDPASIVAGADGVRIFSDRESSALRLRTDELYSFDWSDLGGCPIGYVLAAMASPKVRVAFPDYPIETLPSSLSSYEDRSWHNDSCPCFKVPGAYLLLYVDYADAAQREVDAGFRFSLHRIDSSGSLTSDAAMLETDDFEEVEAAVQREVYAERGAA